MEPGTDGQPLPDGTVYSGRKNFRPFSVPPLDSYTPIVGEEKIERLLAAVERVKGLRILELNATAQGGGVSELLHSSIPLLNSLGIEAEWKVITGSRDYYEVTKSLHNLLQGQEGAFTPEMLKTYVRTIEESACSGLVDGAPDVVIVHDPQPMGLASYVRAMDSVADRESAIWLWRCHIDIEEASLAAHPQLWDFANRWVKSYDAGIFTAAQYVVSQWPTPKFIIPPFIDPLSDKNRPLERGFIDGVLAKYGIDDDIPIILQIGRFDPWKGLDRTITTYRRVRQEVRCQLVLAGGLASDDPEGQRVLDRIQDMTKDDQGIHVLLLSLEDRLSNYLEVNALQSAASVIMQPSTREGFGLVVTEGLWKAKPVIGADVGAIPIQIRDGHTGLFFTTARNTAKKVVGLLSNPKAAKEMGEEARRYVQDHFLLPDRLADYLAAIDMLVNPGRGHALPAESIISFHPWFPLRSHR